MSEKQGKKSIGPKPKTMEVRDLTKQDKQSVEIKFDKDKDSEFYILSFRHKYFDLKEEFKSFQFFVPKENRAIRSTNQETLMVDHYIPLWTRVLNFENDLKIEIFRSKNKCFLSLKKPSKGTNVTIKLPEQSIITLVSKLDSDVYSHFGGFDGAEITISQIGEDEVSIQTISKLCQDPNSKKRKQYI